MAIREKHARYAALDAAGSETVEALTADYAERLPEVKEAFESAKKKNLR